MTAADFKTRAFAWANQFDTVFYLDSNCDTANQLGIYECLVAIVAQPTNQVPHRLPPTLRIDSKSIYDDAFSQLHRFHQQAGGWLFGFLGYDLKNDLENLVSDHDDAIGLPDLYFVQPDIVIAYHKNGEITVWQADKNADAAIDPNLVLDQIRQTPLFAPNIDADSHGILLTPRLLPDEYLAKVRALQTHIQRGDIYEVNFCQEFYAEHCVVSPARLSHLFWQLNQMAQAPMSAYLKLPNDHYVLCASPERFMQKRGDRVWSQPIKGTIKRGQTPAEDEDLKRQLYQSPKERAENVMIVDLVRNDLTRSAVYGTVKVAELFGVYSFQTVHHLVSTITAQLSPQANFSDVLRHAFPMGSMTGAPKIRAMQLIEQYETRRRGLFSGAIGYITPSSDFDFNVVIRSLLHRADTGYWSLQTGGAITAASSPQLEYEECLLKATAIRQLLL